jgi:hypothetical protein
MEMQAGLEEKGGHGALKGGQEWKKRAVKNRVRERKRRQHKRT